MCGVRLVIEAGAFVRLCKRTHAERRGAHVYVRVVSQENKNYKKYDDDAKSGDVWATVDQARVCRGP